MFSCEFCEIFKNTFLHRTPLVAASGLRTYFIYLIKWISLKKITVLWIKNKSCDLGIDIISNTFFTWASSGSSSKFVVYMEVEIFQIDASCMQNVVYKKVYSTPTKILKLKAST